jgi:hypothetical protein
VLFLLSVYKLVFFLTDRGGIASALTLSARYRVLIGSATILTAGILMVLIDLQSFLNKRLNFTLSVSVRVFFDLLLTFSNVA